MAETRNPSPPRRSRSAIRAVEAKYVARLHARERVFGPDHHETLHARWDLALWQHAAEAVTTLTELIPDRERVLGRDHPDTLGARDYLAVCQDRAGDLTAAVTTFTELIPDLERVLGPDDSYTLAARDYLEVIGSEEVEPCP